MYGGRLVYPWQLADAESTVQQPVICRVALHAHTLEFKHPATEKMVKFEAPLPEDMQNLLEMLRKHRKT
jgi:23S rRNA-/tRNA-specific pseudouridylate synthase